MPYCKELNLTRSSLTHCSQKDDMDIRKDNWGEASEVTHCERHKPQEDGDMSVRLSAPLPPSPHGGFKLCET